ncbi:hypothetical protein [Modicisalibacter tunisiensis]|uniref:Uncharacterized protein n=1 Tax=Modicisalibacter tunisiensis TaxID=390637 RepID=A0ABS7X2Y9_9GAMM|nr:hypothetical protein [Modicisalibacter tunisiensis]MBZ9540508.1 hypothetical protein [Modicisalibacter tunisiensis]MBZ9569262.1 hypothetical protein [Modicisalibacter tunisiensis]
MTNAIIPAIAGYPEMVTDIPARDQGSVEAGARAAETWLARPWDDPISHHEHLSQVIPDRFPAHRDAFASGYLGRIHQHLRTPKVAPGQQIVSGEDELTAVLFAMLEEVANVSRKGKLKARSFEARDVMRRVEGLSGAMRDASEEINAEAGGRHGQ